MPGPVSDSYPMPVDHGMRVNWRRDMKRRGYKYFVLKAQDFLTAIGNKEAETFSVMLRKHEDWRTRKKKRPSNNYWVANRDEPFADIIERVIFGKCTETQLQEARDALGLPRQP